MDLFGISDVGFRQVKDPFHLIVAPFGSNFHEAANAAEDWSCGDGSEVFLRCLVDFRHDIELWCSVVVALAVAFEPILLCRSQ